MIRTLSLALLLTAPAFAVTPVTPGVTASSSSQTAPGAIAGGKVAAYDAKAKTMTVVSNGVSTTLGLSQAVIQGNIAVGKTVDVTYLGAQATAVSVR